MTKIFTSPGPCSYESNHHNTISSELNKKLKAKKKATIKKSQSLGHFGQTFTPNQEKNLETALKNHRGYTVGPGDYEISGNLNKPSFLKSAKIGSSGFLNSDKRFKQKKNQLDINEMIQKQYKNPRFALKNVISSQINEDNTKKASSKKKSAVEKSVKNKPSGITFSQADRFNIKTSYLGIIEGIPGPGRYTPNVPKFKNYDNLLPGLQPPVNKKEPNLTKINSMKRESGHYLKKKKASFPKSYSEIMKPLRLKQLRQSKMAKGEELLLTLNSYNPDLKDQEEQKKISPTIPTDRKLKDTKEDILVSAIDYDEASESLTDKSKGNPSYYSPSLKSFVPERSQLNLIRVPQLQTIHRFNVGMGQMQRNLNFMSKEPRFKKKEGNPKMGPGRYLGIRPSWNKKSFNVKYQGKGIFNKIDMY